MARMQPLLCLGMLALAWSGCQCCRLTDPYSDLIDRISTHQGNAEVLYHAGLDLSRIGRPDWCSYPLNRWLCPCACSKVPPPAIPQPIHLGYGWENMVGAIPPSESPEIPPATAPPAEPPLPYGAPGQEMLPEPAPGELVPPEAPPVEPNLIPPMPDIPPVVEPRPAPPTIPQPADPNGSKELGNSEKNDKSYGQVLPASAETRVPDTGGHPL